MKSYWKSVEIFGKFCVNLKNNKFNEENVLKKKELGTYRGKIRVGKSCGTNFVSFNKVQKKFQKAIIIFGSKRKSKKNSK